MVNQSRIKELEQFREQHKARLKNLTEGRDQFLKMKSSGVFISDSDETEDWLQQRANELDEAVKTHQAILIWMESQLDRARNGEDV